MDAVLSAVSNAERRRILDLLKAGERPAGELAAAFPGLPQPAVSRHLKVLREAGLVTVSPRAQRRIYALQPTGLREVDAWISLYREFWSGRLDSLEAHLDRAVGGRTDGEDERRTGGGGRR
ncbi:MAG: metalloregulator ArsR/SmtB family transcription factor [Nitrososphaerales archaeon]